MKRLTWLLLCVACGSDPLLATDFYKVHNTATLTTDPFVKVGDQFYTEWYIEENEDNEGLYSLRVTDCCPHIPEKSGTMLKGRKIKDTLVFSYNDTSGDVCPFFTHLSAQISPEGDGFTGTVSQLYVFCASYNPTDGITNTQDWATEYKVRSE